MRTSKSRGKHYLQCRNRYVDRDACPGAFVPVQQLEHIVLMEINRLSAEYLDRDMLISAIELDNPLDMQRKQLEEAVSVRKRRLAEYASALRSLYLDRARGLVDEQSFLTLLEELNQGKAQTEFTLQADQERIERLCAQTNTEPASERLARYLSPEHLTRDMVESLIDYIAVGRRSPGAKVPPIEIHWKF